MNASHGQRWPTDPNEYQKEILIGYGASAKVHVAKVKNSDGSTRTCALKVLDLESLVHEDVVDEIRKELQAMSLCRHPNILSHYVSFPYKRQVYIVMPLCRGGSCSDLMRLLYSQGLGSTGRKDDLGILAHILKETVKALVYLHDPKQSQVHRDIKAANLLITFNGNEGNGTAAVTSDTNITTNNGSNNTTANNTTANNSTVTGTATGTGTTAASSSNVGGGTANVTESDLPDGTVSLGDFGVAASLKDCRTRQTFVGTPCWLAPEIIRQIPYDSAADIWSLGITALELCSGSAPYQRSTPHHLQILQLILERPPPTGPKEMPQDFHDFITMCLQKEPEKRCTAKHILENSEFLKRADRTALTKVLAKLPPLEQRRKLKAPSSQQNNQNQGGHGHGNNNQGNGGGGGPGNNNNNNNNNNGVGGGGGGPGGANNPNTGNGGGSNEGGKTQGSTDSWCFDLPEDESAKKKDALDGLPEAEG